MRGTLITNLTHFLDERGRVALPPSRARRIAEFLTEIVTAVTHDLDAPLAPIKCRRRPGRKPCPGLIDAYINLEDEVLWQCESCRDQGVITHWQNTFWNLLDAPIPEEARRPGDMLAEQSRR